MPKIKLTDSFIKGVSVKKTTEFYDEITPGLILRVSNKGSKKFEFRYTNPRGLRVRYPIGRYTDITLATARESLKKLNSEVILGFDPQLERSKRKSTVTEKIQIFSDVVELYNQKHIAGLRSSSQREYLRLIKVHIKPTFGRYEVSNITRRDIVDYLDQIAITDGHPTLANRIKAVMSSIFTFGLERDYFDVQNPLKQVKSYADGKVRRDRYYDDSEIKIIWSYLDDEVYEPERSYFKILFLLGQRKMETAKMRKTDVDFTKKIWTLQPSVTKNKQKHTVPLSNFSCELLHKLHELNIKSPYFFQSNRTNTHISEPENISKRIKKIKNSSLSDFRIHDIRRTVGTNMSKLGTSDKVIGLALNHKGMANSNSITSIYIRNDHIDEIRIALENWEQKLLSLVKIRC